MLNYKGVALASALMLVVSPASAQDVKKVVYTDPQIETVSVVAKDLSDIRSKKGTFQVGLTSVVLVHVYDEKTDTWKFVGESKKSK